MPPLIRPAIPVGPSTNRPEAPVTATPPVAVPRVMSTWSAKTRVVLGAGVPAGAPGLTVPVTCSKPKTPVTDWPATVMVARSAPVPLPSCSRIDPAAMVVARDRARGRSWC